jgi:protein arginine N-methyltransferase 1
MSTREYLNFLVDAPRVEAFRAAIERVVAPGQVVLDLGTGAGTYAMFAARAGARVVAVEADPVVGLARALAADNGLAERIVFRGGRLEDFQPAERADVVIFEDFSPYLYDAGTAALLEDVCERWLAPGGAAVPNAVRVVVAPVSCPDTYAALAPWEGDRAYGLDWGRLSGQVLNDLQRAAWSPGVLMAEPAVAARVEILALGPFGLDVTLAWQVVRGGELHGLGLWIDLELAPGVLFSNAPSGRSTGWDQVFLPLSEPVRVEAGEHVKARLLTLGTAPRRPEWWSWRVQAGGISQEMNTFRALALSRARLRGASLASRPALGPRSRIRRAVLELVDGRRTLREIVREVRERFPAEMLGDAEARRAVALALAPEDLEGGVPAEGRLAEVSAGP